MRISKERPGFVHNPCQSYQVTRKRPKPVMWPSWPMYINSSCPPYLVGSCYLWWHCNKVIYVALYCHICELWRFMEDISNLYKWSVLHSMWGSWCYSPSPIALTQSFQTYWKPGKFLMNKLTGSTNPYKFEERKIRIFSAQFLCPRSMYTSSAAPNNPSKR